MSLRPDRVVPLHRRDDIEHLSNQEGLAIAIYVYIQKKQLEKMSH